MQRKLLYIFTALFGVATLVTGYLWHIDDPPHIPTIQKIPIEQQTTNPSTTLKSENEQKNVESVTSYQLPDDTKKIPTNTATEPPDTPTTAEILPEEIFETKVTLQINGKSLLIPYQDDMSAEGAMKEAHSRYPESFSYESIEYGRDLGTFVKSINGIAENNREKMYWILYINGNKSNKGISILKLKPDDIIMWNYEKEIL